MRGQFKIARRLQQLWLMQPDKKQRVTFRDSLMLFELKFFIWIMPAQQYHKLIVRNQTIQDMDP